VTTRPARSAAAILVGGLTLFAGLTGCGEGSRIGASSENQGASTAPAADGPSSAAFFAGATEIVERSLMIDYGDLVSLAALQGSFELGSLAGQYRFAVLVVTLEDVTGLERGPNPFNPNPFGDPLPTDNLKLQLQTSQGAREADLLIGVNAWDGSGNVVSAVTDEDVADLQDDAPVGAEWIVVGAQSEAGDLFISTIIAKGSDGAPVSFGPPVADGVTLDQLKAEAEAIGG
jgi:hypothetical protein